MNTKKTAIFVIGLAILAVAVGFVFVMAKSAFQKKVGSTTVAVFDPFANLVIPAAYASDPPTKAVIEQKIALVKDSYAKRPNSMETWIAIGDIRSLTQDYTGAIRAYEQSLDISKHNIIAYRNIAVVYENNLQDYPKAAENFTLAIKNNPSDIENYMELALIQNQRLHHPLDAEKTLKDGLVVTSNNPDLWLALVRHYQSTGDTANYELQARALMKAYPANTQYRDLFSGVKK